MSGKSQFGSRSGPPGSLACGEFDLLLADAVDGALTGEQLERFNAHATACLACGASFAQAREGMRWMNLLGNAEPPAHLLHNILARTSHAEPAKTPAVAPSQGWSFAGLRKLLSGVLQPRFATTFGMAFFSLSLMFNMAGFRPGGMRPVGLSPLDLSPLALYRLASREYYAASARLVRYYENTRFVYEMEFKVQELRDAAGENKEDSEPEKISVPQDTSRNRIPGRIGGVNSPEDALVAGKLVPFPRAASAVLCPFRPAWFEVGEGREPRQASVAEVALRRIV